MRLYKKEDFLNLPAGTIYSRTTNDHELCEGLYCKPSNIKIYETDFIEQNLISEWGSPDEKPLFVCPFEFQRNLRDTFQDFKTDLNYARRDGMFNEDDRFVVWDKEDITKLIEYLQEALKMQETNRT